MDKSAEELHRELAAIARRLLELDRDTPLAIPIPDTSPPVYVAAGQVGELAAIAKVLELLRNELRAAGSGKATSKPAGLTLVINRDRPA